MFEILAESTPDILAIRISGKLDKSDYDRLHPWLDQRLHEQPRPAMLIVMEDFRGWDSLGAVVEDIKLDMAHHDDLRRIAMVGDQAWQKWMAMIAVPFVSAEIRYFDANEIDLARIWLRGSGNGNG
ncbi:STAS/SEC14 domain-containing protein [Oceanibacterium hippocampi]|uniref:SpoIIAA-like protein n=1 Tax=Oceanibacterium hippocampi TaxID=745714 RepID=A0A1Y5TV47_9PROT|nr:STAS/SEC14 domain-containing protein [Oceanibacterium hippocampi]SLN73897.1 hypothetical protein OCH7691_03677 [Oceanibacterium hippocampi]